MDTGETSWLKAGKLQERIEKREGGDLLFGWR